ncbi:hypothetical protein [Sphingobacterium sp. SYP-B4668]|uniref:hypothetical protein n=1 Tax=Sphingobacterium sp. SYP-B4668 TaxID=2996035 RepID=UPI0022DD8C67|nr:hypothetical protein [Sphingobacterium sp. SYP-B4668]
MRKSFTLPHLPNSILEIETSIWTGRSKLWKDGVELERSSESGKPFLVPTESGEVHKMYPKPSLGQLTPPLEIDGIKYSTAEKLHWYQYALSALPMLLILLGGGLGGGIGALGTIINLNTFSTDEPATMKYLKVIGISILSYVLYALVAYLFVKMMA